ncbi:hypothetical protein CC80DRAFT_552379 [Byssothecium circinans]|uniref:Uncharacterized protein n=1 Tax=Byssothecium circinans TaxID=147558 RepID=A0A6A5TJM6_9PLEO|nr:hypothetical protein CC80DRAFT_552379 [Byssothecium circinans]
MGFGYFLTEHKAQMGLKFISRLQVFSANTMYGSPCVIACVEDVPFAPSKRRGNYDLGLGTGGGMGNGRKRTHKMAGKEPRAHL